MDAQTLIDRLGLRPHPEGGHFVETWRAPAGPDGTRAAGSTILYLLAAGERSHWHRVDAAEVWHYAAGAPLELRLWAEDQTTVPAIRVGDAERDGATPHGVVPAGWWQAARSLGAWTLVGCIVMPAFDFAGFELAPPGWEPPGWEPPG